MSFVAAAIGVGGALLGGKMAADGAKDAARISAQGSTEALAENRRQFDLSMLANILLNAPSINSGNSARSALAAMLGLDTPATDYSQLASLFGGGGQNTNTGGGAPLQSFSRNGGSIFPLAMQVINSRAQQQAGGSAGSLSPIGQAFGTLSAPGSSAVDPSKMMQIIEATPGFGFAKDQAMRGIMGNSRAIGLGKSGASVQSIGDTIGQGLAMPVYESYLNRLAQMAGVGSGTSSGLASNIGSLASNSGALNAGLIQNQADSRASGQLGQAGAWQGALNNIGAIAGDYFGRQRGGSGAAYDRRYGTDIF